MLLHFSDTVVLLFELDIIQCPDSTGCDICPNGAIVDDSKVVTYTAGGEAVESATCAEWFLFGCTFAEPDICDALVTGVAECCGDGTTAADDTDTESSPNSACLSCLEDPAADPVQSCSDVCTTSTQGSTSHSAACLECIEAPGADPADCVSQCDTTTAATNGNDVACAQCLEGEGANPGVCDEICHGVASGTPTSSSTHASVALVGAAIALALLA